MKELKTHGNNSIQSAGNVLLRCTIGVVLVFIGYETAYFLDSDWDKDGVSNEVEERCGMDPRHKDSDGDGIKDGGDSYPLIPESEGFFSDTNTVICLTSPADKRKTVCFRPADILLFQISEEGNYLVYNWKADAEYVQENLTTIERIIWNIGYTHFFRVNPQDLPNMLLAECITRDMTKLYMSQEENIWCYVPRDKRQIVVIQVNRLCDDENE